MSVLLYVKIKIISVRPFSHSIRQLCIEFLNLKIFSSSTAVLEMIFKRFFFNSPFFLMKFSLYRQNHVRLYEYMVLA